MHSVPKANHSVTVLECRPDRPQRNHGDLNAMHRDTSDPVVEAELTESTNAVLSGVGLIKGDLQATMTRDARLGLEARIPGGPFCLIGASTGHRDGSPGLVDLHASTPDPVRCPRQDQLSYKGKSRRSVHLDLGSELTTSAWVGDADLLRLSVTRTSATRIELDTARYGTLLREMPASSGREAI